MIVVDTGPEEGGHTLCTAKNSFSKPFCFQTITSTIVAVFSPGTIVMCLAAHIGLLKHVIYILARYQSKTISLISSKLMQSTIRISTPFNPVSADFVL